MPKDSNITGILGSGHLVGQKPYYVAPSSSSAALCPTKSDSVLVVYMIKQSKRVGPTGFLGESPGIPRGFKGSPGGPRGVHGGIPGSSPRVPGPSRLCLLCDTADTVCCMPLGPLWAALGFLWHPQGGPTSAQGGSTRAQGEPTSAQWGGARGPTRGPQGPKRELQGPKGGPQGAPTKG